jgi:hypothetical protein
MGLSDELRRVAQTFRSLTATRKWWVEVGFTNMDDEYETQDVGIEAPDRISAEQLAVDAMRETYGERDFEVVDVKGSTPNFVDPSQQVSIDHLYKSLDNSVDQGTVERLNNLYRQSRRKQGRKD